MLKLLKSGKLLSALLKSEISYKIGAKVIASQVNKNMTKTVYRQ